MGIRTSPQPGRTILVVEDEPAVRRLICTILSRAGFSVLEAENATVALETARREDALDLLVTDVVMPTGSGVALVNQLSQERPGLKAIVISGYAEGTLFPREGPRLHARFIQKPFTPAEFLTSIHEVLSTPA